MLLPDQKSRVKTRKRAFSHISLNELYRYLCNKADNFICITYQYQNIPLYVSRYFINNLENMSKYRLIDIMNVNLLPVHTAEKQQKGNTVNNQMKMFVPAVVRRPRQRLPASLTIAIPPSRWKKSPHPQAEKE
ncbi:hypothetical protein KCP69_11685 [Salmonella enterica subsp. enterica]|nr:hypothetical protein KCP69_11685 [Salmonella enterica subsp. enterica]